MTKIHPQVMQGAGYFHDQIDEACFGVAKLVFDDATTFQTSDGVFDDNANTRQQTIQGLIQHA